MTKKETGIRGWQQEALQYLSKGKYDKACKLYEQAIEVEPDVRSNYWYLGLSLLLQGQEVEAQVTWMLVIGEGDGEEVEQWTGELIYVLQTEAQRLEKVASYPEAWAIRHHIREIDPGDINNLLRILQLSVKLEKFTGEELKDWGVIELLKSEQKKDVNGDLLLEVFTGILKAHPLMPMLAEFAEACLLQVNKTDALIKELLFVSEKIAQTFYLPDIAISLVELSLRWEPENKDAWKSLAIYCQNAGKYDRGIEAAKRCDSLMRKLPDRVLATHVLLRGLLSSGGGDWSEAIAVCDRQESMLREMTQQKEKDIDVITSISLHNSAYFFPYFKDDIKKNREIQNKLASFCQEQMERHQQEQVERYRTRHLSGLLSGASPKLKKIGYLCHCFSEHSVGWLSRWLFEHHDRQKYEIYGYFINYRHHRRDILQEWFVNHMSQPRKLAVNLVQIAEQIYQDEINVLVDMDSITLDISCGVMGLKPAPVQVTWLGWDASGNPTIDYMIADPYVLPENAQDYYSETIWRLPKTYVAVDGFEVGVPTLRRDRLDIPSDAVLYLSAQKGYKRHPDTARLQMKIIKEVPKSYLLIKGLADEEVIKGFFLQLAEEEGVSGDRLRFLPMVNSEATHRANLGIADVVLDTYPYNGATTTLETLWMCVPLVTRVGEQFAARNSYTMMMNAGITEGIAWTDEEYVEWGVRLGEDPVLRQEISWRLRQSRQTAPLWNAKQFTREMENAYEQMWQRYLESGNGNI